MTWKEEIPSTNPDHTWSKNYSDIYIKNNCDMSDKVGDNELKLDNWEGLK